MNYSLAKHPGFTRSLPFGLFLFVLAIELSWTTLQPVFPGLDQIDKRVLYRIKSGLAAIALVWLWPSYTELRQTPRPLSNWVVAIVTGLGVFGLWINLTQSWALLNKMGMGFNPYQPDGQINWWLTGIRLAGSALVVPIIEELFWRSFIMRWVDKQDFLTLDPRDVGYRGLLVSSGLFALEHTQWVAGFLAGFAYGWLYRKTGNLWLSILAHAITNAALGAWVIYTGNWQFW
ncbi:MAG: CAAX prenyl protease-related protein [Thiobacillaceae bacterium]